MTSQNEAVCFGIDVSKHWLDIAEHPSAQVTRIDNTAAAIRGWLRTLPRGAQRIACESTGSYHCTLVELLIKAGHQVFLIDGFKLSRYRDTVGQRAKTDRHDARLIARYLAHEGTDLRPFSMPAPAVIELRSLLRRRATVVRSLGRIRQSMEDLPGFGREVRVALARLTALIKRFEQRIASLINESGWTEPYRRILKIEGVGALTAAGLCATFHRAPFSGADAFIAFLGMDVSVRDSGKKTGRRALSKKGDSEMRRLLYNAAMAASRSTTWQPFYQRMLQRGFSRTQALVALARKLARVAFSLMKNAADYVPKQHENACGGT